MKPCFLEFCGINSFSEPAVIDFGRLLEDGLFGIFGDTGSGKSTVLDAIGFALYGNVSRSRTGSIADVINYNSDRAYAIFEFEIAFAGKRRRFRVERELRRKNAAQSVKVYERGDTLSARAEGVRECNAFLERVIGLEQKDFEKCIALPQGEFAQFVRSARGDRLKLVSRLFDLEAYGERLVKRANARAAEAAHALELCLARLEPYSGYTEEGVRALEGLTEELLEREKRLGDELERAQREERKIADLKKQREVREWALARLAELEAEGERMALIEKQLGRLDLAASATRAAEENREAERDLLIAEERFSAAEKELEALRARLASLGEIDEEGAEEELARLREWIDRAKEAAAAARRGDELTEELDKNRAAYRAEAEEFKDFHYEAELSAIEKRRAALSSEDFLSYAERHGKAALLRGEYAVFADELSGIEEEFPETEGRVSPLVQKYRSLSEGEKTDLAALRASYEEREKKRQEADEELLALTRRNGLYRAHGERLRLLQTEGDRLTRELEALSGKAEGAEDPEALERLFAEKRAAQREASLKRERAKEDLSGAKNRYTAAEVNRSAAKKAAEGAARRLEEALSAGGFSGEREAEELALRFGDPASARRRLKEYTNERAALSAKVAESDGADLSAGTRERAEEAKRAAEEAANAHRETIGELARRTEELKESRKNLALKKELEGERVRAAEKAAVSERLKKLLEGNKFMEFAAEEHLQRVAENGSGRLLSLTGGRFFLRYEGGSFLVGDNLGGGALRGVYTLSGGETFLVSLSLALALSEEIVQRSLRPIEFFFLDEGFGTLDEHLVDTVMDSLERLRGEHFAIGIISHVEELKHRIERKLLVEKATESHGSRIHTD